MNQCRWTGSPRETFELKKSRCHRANGTKYCEQIRSKLIFLIEGAVLGLEGLVVCSLRGQFSVKDTKNWFV